MDDASDVDEITTETGNVTTATIKFLSPYSNYTVWARALNQAGASAPSNTVTIETKQAGTAAYSIQYCLKNLKP